MTVITVVYGQEIKLRTLGFSQAPISRSLSVNNTLVTVITVVYCQEMLCDLTDQNADKGEILILARQACLWRRRLTIFIRKDSEVTEIIKETATEMLKSGETKPEPQTAFGKWLSKSYDTVGRKQQVEEVRSFEFDSYMVASNELSKGALRLLEVDNRCVLPVRTHIKLLVTSTDVLHSWSVPSFGIKIDACPGRLSQGALFIKRVGVYYGQCSEICGVNHGFMPVVVQGVTENDFKRWVYSQNSDE